ncbi:ATP-binding protein [Geodermatophilus sp. SYSU D00758]
MTLARTWSVGLAGVQGAMVEVEVDMSAGVPGVVLVGLPDAVVRQSVDRVRAAVVNTGARWPLRRITIGLSPAAMPKQGSGFDLALAAAVLAADGAVPAAALDDLVLLGELGLDGSVRAVRGVLPAVLAAVRAGHPAVVVPAGNADEAALVDGVEVLPAATLADVVAHLTGRTPLARHDRVRVPPPPPGPDLGDVLGQAAGRRAVEVAAAGGHHLFLSGPPGAGKTMLAERLPGLLPPLDEAAALEVTAIHSVAGTLPPGAPLVTRPTFEAPHHSATMAALVGGGSGPIRPGALCRAHASVQLCTLSLRGAKRRASISLGALMDSRRAGIYLRISDDKTGQGLGVARQEADCRRLCDSLGWVAAEVYADNDLSGFTGVLRPQYRRLLQDLQEGRIDAVAVWHHDRLHRSPKELEEFIDICERHHVAVQTVKAGAIDLVTPAGRAVARTLGAWARYESEHKAERQRRKAFELAQRGQLAGGGYRPYGFDADRITIKEDEAERIRELRDRLFSGEPMGALVADFNRRKIPTSEGGKWTNTTMRRLLTNPRISGQRGYQPTTEKRTVYGGEPVAKAVWPAIISPADTARLRAILINADRSQARANPRRYLLTNILVCDRCGHGMCGRPRDDGRPRYVCNHIFDNGRCGKTFVLAEPADELVVGMVREALNTPAFWSALSHTPDQPDEDDLLLLGAAQDKLDELARDYATGLIGRSEWLAAREVLEGQLTAVRARLSRSSPRFALTELAGEDFDTRFAALTLSRKRAVLSAALLEVRVKPAVRGRNVCDEKWALRFQPHWRI